MKTWALIISIIVILALVCSPALATSKSDLMSFYKGQSAPNIPTPSVTPSIPSWVVTPSPTPYFTNVIRVPPDWVGSISVVSAPPGANVYLDGQFRGTTPITITGVKAGYYPCEGDFNPAEYSCGFCGTGPVYHDLIVTMTGYQDYHPNSIVVRKGETVSISATLTPISTTKTPTNIPIPLPTRMPTGTGTGTLSVRSIPLGAPVIIDGVYKGMTPVTINGVSAGVATYYTQLEMAGFLHRDLPLLADPFRSTATSSEPFLHCFIYILFPRANHAR